MSNSFEYNNYTIVSSLNEEEENIYIKVIDKVSLMYYENTFDLQKLGVSFSLTDTYQIINKCFMKESGYKATLTISPDMITTNMTVLFEAIIGGFLNVQFDIILMEKVMSNDSQVSINFQKIEQQYLQATQTIEMLTQRLEKLESLVEALSNAEICLHSEGEIWPKSNAPPLKALKIIPKHFWNINTTVIELQQYVKYDLSKIKLLYNLESLTTNDTDYFDQLKSVSLKILIIKYTRCTSFNFLKNIPNLEILQLEKVENLYDLVNVLKSYEHKIQKITIKLYSNSQLSTQELSHYTLTNNITLNISQA